MQVEINGEKTQVSATTLAELIAERGFDSTSVATAMDGDFVPRGLRQTASLREGSKIEVLSPMQGG